MKKSILIQLSLLLLAIGNCAAQTTDTIWNAQPQPVQAIDTARLNSIQRKICGISSNSTRRQAKCGWCNLALKIAKNVLFMTSTHYISITTMIW